MAINKEVKTRFTVNDKITKRFGIMAKAAARFGSTAEKSFRRASRSAFRFSDITKGIVAGFGITKALSLLQQGISGITSGFIAFEKAARGATVRFKDIGPEAANFNEQMKLVRASAREAGATTEFTAAQAAESLDFLARAGFTSAEAMGSLKSMIDLSTASGEDFATVADQSSDLLGAFGLNVADTTQKIANLNRVNDVLVKSANSANVTIEDMFETMKEAAPIGRTLGIELEEIAALTTVMGNAGIKGTKAGTALKNAFLRLSTGGKPITAMLDKIGVRIDDGSGNMRKFSDILQDVGKSIKGVGQLEQAKVLDTLFGKRAIAGASNLVASISEVKEFEKALKNAGGTSNKTAEIMRQSLDAQLRTMVSTATDAGFSILTAFEVDGKRGIEALTEAIRNFDVTPIVDFFKFVGAGVKFIWEWRNAILAVGAVFFGLKAIIGIITTLMTAFNLVMMLNPVGLVVLAVTALIAGFAVLFSWTDDLIAAFDSMPVVIQMLLAPIRLLLEAVRLVKKGFGAAADFFGGGDDEGTKEPPKTPADLFLAKEKSRAPIPGAERRAPNADVAEARAEASAASFKGRLDIAGAPEGSKVSTSSENTPGFNLALLGAS